MASTINKIKLLGGLLLGDKAFNAPFFVDVELTNKCNLHCAGCQYFSPYADRTENRTSDIKEMPYELFQKMCIELSGMKTRYMVLQGAGEPLLHTRFKDLVLAAKETGFRIELITNGTLLNDSMIDFLIKAGLQTIKISLSASNVEQYKKYYPGTKPEMFQKILLAVEQFRQRKRECHTGFPKLYISFPVHRYNYQSLETIIDLAYKCGCNGIHFTPLHTIRGSLSSWSLSPEELQYINGELPRLREKLKRNRMDHNITQFLQRLEYGEDGWKYAPCYVGWYHVRICVDGTVQPCGRCDMSFGNLTDMTLAKIWNDTSLQTFRRINLKRGGVKEFGEKCYCGVCCYWPHSRKIYTFHKWFYGKDTHEIQTIEYER